MSRVSDVIEKSKIMWLYLLSFLATLWAQTDRPNIIFVLTDDQRWDALGAMGINEIIETPAMDAMANEGVLFKNAYVTTSICAASRASIYLGEHQNRTMDDRVVRFNDNLTADRMQRTIHGLLQKDNYYTGFIGKWHLRNANTTGFDYIVKTWHNYFNLKGELHRDPDGTPIHLTRLMGNQALEFLDGVPDNRPFYLNVNTKAPHAQDNYPAGQQFPPDRDLLSLYQDVEVPMPPTADPSFFESLPPFLKTGILRTRWQKRFGIFPEKIDINGDGIANVYDIWQYGVKDYYRLVTGIDRQLARIRAKLKEIGQEKNTIIILLGDNGMFLGERGYSGKWLAHEHSIRVPLIIYDPRAPERLKGQRREEIALNIDIAPTILKMAGIPVPKEVQGHALQPLLTDQATLWRSDFFYEHPVGGDNIQRSEALVERRYKYIQYYDDPYIELYDVVNDPYEMNNLAYDEKFKPKLDSMKTRLEEAKISAYNDNTIKERQVPINGSVAVSNRKPMMIPSFQASMTRGTLKITSGIPDGEFQIVKLNGSVVFNGKLDDGGETRVHLGNNLTTGIYILKIQGTRNSRKLLIAQNL